jgi:rhodanese-related sulfurtransferase
MLAGKIAGENLALKTRPMIPLFNIRILKIFDLQIGSIGLRENKAQANNTQYRVVRGLFSDKAHYLPEVNLVSAKMLFSPAEGRILGFQAASKGSIIQYLDTVSGLMKYKGTVFDLAELEPANTPALADIDYPFHFLANYAISLLKNGAQGISPLEFGERAKSSLVLDVREDYEVADKPLRIQAKAMLHIPSASVKKRLSEIPPGFPVIAVCGRGSRSCNIANLLKRSGIKEAYYVSGGLSFWQ